MFRNNIHTNNTREIIFSNILHQKSFCNFLMITKWYTVFCLMIISAMQSFANNTTETINKLDNKINVPILLKQNSVNYIYSPEQKDQILNIIKFAKMNKSLHGNLINKEVQEIGCLCLGERIRSKREQICIF